MTIAKPGPIERDTVYVDDIVIASVGSRATREFRLACLLYTAAAFGVRINLKKGERGRRVTWIGCTIEVPVVNIIVILGISKQMIDQVMTTLHTWDQSRS